MNNNYVCEITDINHVSYLVSVCGYKIENIHYITSKKNGKQIMCFVFYESQNVISASICDYLNGEISKFNRTKNELLSLIRQSKSISKEEFLEKANG